MRHIFDTRSKPGRLITIMRVRILASDRGYQIRGRRRQSFKPNGIVFRRIAELQRPPSWVVCITNTGWRKLPHDDNAFKHSKTSESIFCGAQGKTFLQKALSNPDNRTPRVLCMDRCRIYPAAIRDLRAEGR